MTKVDLRISKKPASLNSIFNLGCNKKTGQLGFGLCDYFCLSNACKMNQTCSTSFRCLRSFFPKLIPGTQGFADVNGFGGSGVSFAGVRRILASSLGCHDGSDDHPELRKEVCEPASARPTGTELFSDANCSGHIDRRGERCGDHRAGEVTLTTLRARFPPMPAIARIRLIWQNWQQISRRPCSLLSNVLSH